jgi:hypothetical protein
MNNAMALEYLHAFALEIKIMLWHWTIGMLVHWKLNE